MPEKVVYLSLGSNLGDRATNLANAIEKLQSAGVRITRRSSVYETEPQDVKAQPMFLNMALEARTRLFPLQLLRTAMRIEHELGRDRSKQLQEKGPRVVDIDILLYGDAAINAPDLTVPHPRLHERRFVLAPLVEIAPSLRHPVTRRLMSEYLRAMQGQRVTIHHAALNPAISGK